MPSSPLSASLMQSVPAHFLNYTPLLKESAATAKYSPMTPMTHKLHAISEMLETPANMKATAGILFNRNAARVSAATRATDQKQQQLPSAFDGRFRRPSEDMTDFFRRAKKNSVDLSGAAAASRG